MKKLLLLIFLIPLLSIGQEKYTDNDFANHSRFQKENITLKENENYPETIFMGNSITALWYNLDPKFFKENNILSRGIGGQVTSQMLVRFREDVINLRPKRVVILAGTNDIAENQGPISLENIFGNIVSMAELAQANGIEIILSSVLPTNKYPWHKEIKPADKIIALNSMLKAYANTHDLVYIDYYPKLKNSKKGIPKKFSEDGVHPNKKGYAVMEDIFLRTLQ